MSRDGDKVMTVHEPGQVAMLESQQTPFYETCARP